jgi:hypothetical protein
MSTSLNGTHLVCVENIHPRNLSWTLKKKVARRDEYRCCLTRLRCRFWKTWDVFPIIPPTAFYIREVRQTRRYISDKFLILFVAKAV